MSIDRSKAPEGATHKAKDGLCFYKHVFGEGVVYYWTSGRWIPCAPITNYEGGLDKCMIPLALALAWNGEGLPPVGVVCEINHPELGWARCDIVAHKVMDCGGKTHAIAWIDGNTLDQSQGLRFRPIRTPEQIAEEERDAALNQMVRSIKDHPNKYQGVPHLTQLTIQEDACIDLYDAGWRRFEIADEEVRP